MLHYYGHCNFLSGTFNLSLNKNQIFGAMNLKLQKSITHFGFTTSQAFWYNQVTVCLNTKLAHTAI